MTSHKVKTIYCDISNCQRKLHKIKNEKMKQVISCTVYKLKIEY